MLNKCLYTEEYLRTFQTKSNDILYNAPISRHTAGIMGFFMQI